MLTLVFLAVIIILIIFSTTKFHLHPFLTLLLAAILMGFIGGLDVRTVISKLTDGFGNTLKSIGIVIACGTIIGTFLERSGGAKTMAASILKLVGEKRAPLAMSITGFIVSIPVFCDSGFVILSALNRALSKRTGRSLTVLAVALGTGLYTTHVFVPPTPGPLAAAATIGADIGSIILLGLIVSVPTAGVGLLWALVYSKRFRIVPGELVKSDENSQVKPNIWFSYAPIFVPIILIALKSIGDYPTAPLGTGVAKSIFGFIGHPVIALIIGVFFAFTLKSRKMDGTNFDWVVAGLKNAGSIILITGAGGAFGTVLRATGIGNVIGHTMAQWHLGIFLPFIIAAVLKTAQGSSTVAIITTAALVSPLLNPMGLSAPLARVLVVLAIGAGAMTISHVNDSYFWVVAQFSDMDTGMALRCHSMATLWQGVVGILTIVVLKAILIR